MQQHGRHIGVAAGTVHQAAQGIGTQGLLGGAVRQVAGEPGHRLHRSAACSDDHVHAAVRQLLGKGLLLLGGAGLAGGCAPAQGNHHHLGALFPHGSHVSQNGVSAVAYSIQRHSKGVLILVDGLLALVGQHIGVVQHGHLHAAQLHHALVKAGAGFIGVGTNHRHALILRSGDGRSQTVHAQVIGVAIAQRHHVDPHAGQHGQHRLGGVGVGQLALWENDVLQRHHGQVGGELVFHQGQDVREIVLLGFLVIVVLPQLRVHNDAAAKGSREAPTRHRRSRGCRRCHRRSSRNGLKQRHGCNHGFCGL